MLGKIGAIMLFGKGTTISFSRRQNSILCISAEVVLIKTSNIKVDFVVLLFYSSTRVQGGMKYLHEDNTVIILPVRNGRW